MRERIIPAAAWEISVIPPLIVGGGGGGDAEAVLTVL